MNDIRKKVYQMFILGFENENFDIESNIGKALENGLGGTILFTKNIKSIEQTKKLNQKTKQLAIIPPFISIDEEGGRVERTENIFGEKKFLSAKFAAQKGNDFVKSQTMQISQLLKSMEFNLNYAPCLDVNSNPQNPIIGERAFSEKNNEVAEFGKIVSETYLQNGIIPCGKHFPGHGDASVDSHKELPVIDLPLDKMIETHIKPFLEVNPPMIMVAHLYCKAFDKEIIPSSLSKNILNFLTEKCKYNGLIISDDMVMGGVTGDNLLEIAIKAIKAGINILLYRDSQDEIIEIIEGIINASSNDEELLNNIEKSCNKIISFKKKYMKLLT